MLRKDWVVIAVALGGWALSAYAAYNHDDKSLSNRITAVETRQADDQGKIDHIQTQVDKLVEWALGHK